MRRLFTVLMMLALTIAGAELLTQQGRGLEAATPLPSGCYTDASGLPVCGPNYPGPGGTPGPQATPTGGLCIAVSTPPAAGSIAYTCPTPGPQETASPTASAPIVVSSTYPYLITAQTPAPTATATACAASPSVTGTWPYTFNIPAGCSSSSGGYASYAAMVQADNPTLFFPLADATAAPGAVDTQVVDTWAPTGTPGTQTTGLTFDGHKATTFASTGNYYSSGGQQVQDIPFTWEAWVKYPSLPGTTAYIYCTDALSGVAGFGVKVAATTGVVSLSFFNIGDKTTNVTLDTNVHYLAFKYDPQKAYNNTNTWTFYEDGVPTATGTQLVNVGTNVIGEIGACNAGGGGQGVVMQYVGLYYNKALADPRILAHYNGGHSGVYQ